MKAAPLRFGGPFILIVGIVQAAAGKPGLASPIGVATALFPVAVAWVRARGTALRPSLAWAGLSLFLGVVEGIVAGMEPPASGLPAAGHWAYLSTLAGLSASIAVLNARRPGVGAWAILMGMLALVMLVPWLEGTGLARGGGPWARLRLESPWTIFYLLLVVAGITNYLTTRFGPAAAIALVGLLLEYAALGGWIGPLEHRGRVWSIVPSTFALAAWSALGLSKSPRAGRSDLDRLWLWFRDGWGVVWALRTMERFNRAAEVSGLVRAARLARVDGGHRGRRRAAPGDAGAVRRQGSDRGGDRGALIAARDGP